MSRKIVFSNPTAPATSKQTWAIRCLRLSLKMPTGDTRNENFTMESAAAEIGQLIALKNLKATGVDISPMVQQLAALRAAQTPVVHP